MDGFIDRLAELLRALFGNDEERPSGRGRPFEEVRGPRGAFRDPDLQEAWDELDDFMRTGTAGAGSEGRGSGAQGRAGHGRGGQARGRRAGLDESLRQDYENLEVPFGADIEEVRKSYKRLMMKYHPDKHAGNPEKQKMALEISKKINESFERIRSAQEMDR